MKLWSLQDVRSRVLRLHIRAVRHASSMTDGMLETLFSCLAEFYLANPFRLQNLSRGQTAIRMGI